MLVNIKVRKKSIVALNFILFGSNRLNTFRSEYEQFSLLFFFQEYQIIDFDKSWATVGLKLACSWVCGLIYLVFLLLPNRCCCPIFSTLLTSNSNGTGHFFSRHIIFHLVLPKMGCLIESALKFQIF